MPYLPSPRLINLGIFLATVVAMLAVLGLQYYDHLDPCPLCVLQRVGMIATGSVALVAFLHGPAGVGRRIYAGLTLLAALGGAAVSARHVWLQHLPPDEAPACGPGLDYWLDTFPLHEVIAKILHGTGECAVVDWTFLGLALPSWAFLGFVGLAVIAIWQLLRRS